MRAIAGPDRRCERLKRRCSRKCVAPLWCGRSSSEPPGLPGGDAGVGVGVGAVLLLFGVGTILGAPLASPTMPHLSEFVIGSFQSLRIVCGRLSYISLSEFG